MTQSSTENPTTTVQQVETDANGHMTITSSCGHSTGFASLRTPEVGEPWDCFSCSLMRMHQRTRDERNARRRARRRVQRAAPELLEAGKELLDAFLAVAPSTMQLRVVQDAMSRWLDVAAKAEGRQP